MCTWRDGDPCDRPIKARGLCEMHYERARSYRRLHTYPTVGPPLTHEQARAAGQFVCTCAVAAGRAGGECRSCRRLIWRRA